MDIKYVLGLLFLCVTAQCEAEGRKRCGSSIAGSNPQLKRRAIRGSDCVWEEDLCNRARPLYIDPDARDGPYSILYLPSGECTAKDPKCAKMRVPNGKKVVVACTGKNSELLRRKSTYAEATCNNGRFVDAAGQRVGTTPIIEDSCTKEQKVEFSEIQQANSQIQPFVLSFVVKGQRNFKVKIMDGIVDSSWNALFTRSTQPASINTVACPDRKDNFVTFSKFSSGAAASYGDNVWYKNVMKSTCRLNDQQVASLTQGDVISKMYPSRGSTALDVKKSYTYRLIKGHLTANRDFSLKYMQDATFTYYNVAPQWQSVNVGPWSVVEDKVRKAAELAGETINVITGTHGDLCLPLNCGTDQNNNNPTCVKVSTFGGTYRLPKLFWKLYYKSSGSINQSTVLVAFNTLKTDSLQNDKTYNDLIKKCESLPGAVYECQFRNFKDIYNDNGGSARTDLQQLIAALP